MVNTSWAVLALIHANYPNQEVMRKGCKLIMERQLFDGSWAQEGIEGVFNKNCAIVSRCLTSSEKLLLISIFLFR